MQIKSGSAGRASFPRRGRGRSMSDDPSLRVHGSVVSSRRRGFGVLLAGCATFAAAAAPGQEIESDPVNYSAATARNAVTELKERLAAGEAKLDFEAEHGYLRPLLRAL